MTRAEKIEKRKARSANRRAKRAAELIKIQAKMACEDIPFQMARANVRGKHWGVGFQCEMRYASCEARGFCNGDC